MHAPINDRWSARGYSADATVEPTEITDILEAGRWAPTWGRIQPVRFIVGIRGDDTFTALSTTLTRGNKSWAPAAGALILLCTTDDPTDAKVHEYGAVDLGFAAAQMSIQAVSMGLNAHPMAGFDATAARELFAVPVGHRPMLILALGRLAADTSTLDAEIRERDEWPRERLPLNEIAFSGSWGQPFDAAG